MTRSTMWTPSMLNVLLCHLEKHKGDEGWYRTNPGAAYKDASSLLKQTFSCKLVTASKVSQKLLDLRRRKYRRDYHKEPSNDYFLTKGRRILRDPYNKSTSFASDHPAPCNHPECRVTSSEPAEVREARQSLQVLLPPLPDGLHLKKPSPDSIECAFHSTILKDK